MNREEVKKTCSKIAPIYSLEPELVFAVCLQESERDKNGEFKPDVARLEQGYYRRYVEPSELATTSEVLLSASYGVMQMMGMSLKELGYFGWYFDRSSTYLQNLLATPFSQFAIPSAIDYYCVHLDVQIEWGCKWLMKKRNIAKGDIKKMLGFWNGDTSGRYAGEVLERYNKLKANFV